MDTHGHGTAGHALDVPARDLVGREVVDMRGERLGRVDAVFVDDDETPRYLAIETGWYGAERAVLPVEGIDRGADGNAVSRYPRAHVAEGPRVDRDKALRVDEASEIHEHYGLGSIEGARRARQTAPAPTPEIAEAEIASAVRGGGDPGHVVARRWGT